MLGDEGGLTRSYSGYIIGVWIKKQNVKDITVKIVSLVAIIKELPA